jgi:hypothetical protein
VEDGRCRRHGRLIPRQNMRGGGLFVDDHGEVCARSCPRLEPESVRSVQRVTAVA